MESKNLKERILVELYKILNLKNFMNLNESTDLEILLLSSQNLKTLND